MLDQASQIVTAAEAGVGQAEFATLQERVRRGESIACLQRALAADAVVPMENRQTLCGPCPLAAQECGCTPLAVRLIWNGDVYGVMVASVPSAFAADPEELDLVAEVAGDISFALHNMESEHQRQLAENALRLEQSRLEALLQLNQMTDAPLQDITDFVLEAGVRLTQSRIGYLAFLNKDESVLTMHAWSKTAMNECAIIDKPIHYPVVTTGLWGEAVRQRQPVFTNDYPAPNPLKKGYPAGHVHVQRHMNVPIFDGQRIVAVMGVGNKEPPYDDSDVRQLTLLGQGMWRLLCRREEQEELRRPRRAGGARSRPHGGTGQCERRIAAGTRLAAYHDGQSPAQHLLQGRIQSLYPHQSGPGPLVRHRRSVSSRGQDGRRLFQRRPRGPGFGR